MDRGRIDRKDSEREDRGRKPVGVGHLPPQPAHHAVVYERLHIVLSNLKEGEREERERERDRETEREESACAVNERFHIDLT